MSLLDALMVTRRPYLNDGGIETDLIFGHGFDLPFFSSFVLLNDQKGRAALHAYFGAYLDLAAAEGRGFLLDTATWRANAGWLPKHGLGAEAVRDINLGAVDLARAIRAAHPGTATVLINGNIGPTGDGYAPEQCLTAAEADSLHRPQMEALAEAGVDLATALTMTHVGEAVGVARAAQAAGVPVAISFTVETDGRLPVGTTLGEAITAVDEATGGAPLYFGINCAHPTHFIDRLEGAWTKRIGLVRANASRQSHAELDEATELDAGDPGEFGPLYQELAERLPNLRVVGGCCGTDHRHVTAIAHSA